MFIEFRSQLPGLVKALDLPLIAAEVGTAEARFSEQLLAGGIEKLYSIDYWGQLNQAGDGGFEDSWHQNNYKEALERLSKYGDRSLILRGLSYDMAKKIPDEYLGMVYIDCDHSYSGCMRDLEEYYPKVVKGGIVAGHDVLNEAYGVKQAVTEFCNARGIEFNIIPDEEPSMASFWFIKQ